MTDFLPVPSSLHCNILRPNELSLHAVRATRLLRADEDLHSVNQACPTQILACGRTGWWSNRRAYRIPEHAVHRKFG